MKDWLLEFEKKSSLANIIKLYKDITNIKIQQSIHYIHILEINNIPFCYDVELMIHQKHGGLTIPDYLISENLIDENKFIIERLKRL